MSSSREPLAVTFLHRLGIKNGIPVSGTFELTERCNFNCEMCYVHDLKIKKDPLSAEDWIHLGQEAKKTGTIFLLLTGGEPLLRDDFAKIYTALIEMGFFISINTNGSLVDRYIDLFKKYPPSRFNISLYGSNDEAYKSLCKVNKYQKVVDNIKLLKDNGFDVRMNMVLTPANASCYKGICDKAKELNTPLKPTTYSFPQLRLGKHDDKVRFTPEEAAKYTFLIDKYYKDSDVYKMKIDSFCEIPDDCRNDRVRCRAGRASFWLTSEGAMRPCGMLTEPNSYPLIDGFEVAWKQTLQQTADIRLPKECTDCEYSGVCMVCAAMCKAETGEFNKKPEYICRMVKELHRLAMKESEADKNEN